MKLSREQMLAEMGITPIWRLRTDGRAVPVEEAPVEASSSELAPPPDLPQHRHATQPTTASRQEQIARFDWQALKGSVDTCQACVLCEHRKQAVLGVGDPEADWLFIGEGPGAEEDVQGEPFVGQAGKLLDNMLAAIELKRGDNVYIANAVKCRPPGNRTPAADEMAACRPYLERQIDLVKPKLIVLLGRAAVASILERDQSLAALRGKTFTYRGIPVVVTYHPAYLLRNLPEKSKAWEDLVYARRLMRHILQGEQDRPPLAGG